MGNKSSTINGSGSIPGNLDKPNVENFIKDNMQNKMDDRVPTVPSQIEPNQQDNIHNPQKDNQKELLDNERSQKVYSIVKPLNINNSNDTNSNENNQPNVAHQNDKIQDIVIRAGDDSEHQIALEVNFIRFYHLQHWDELLGRRTLNFSNTRLNQLKQLPKRLFSLQKIENLWLSNCGLASIPENFGQFKQLQYLSFEKNRKLKKLPAFLRQLPKLKLLSFDIQLLPSKSLGCPELSSLREMTIILYYQQVISDNEIFRLKNEGAKRDINVHFLQRIRSQF